MRTEDFNSRYPSIHSLRNRARRRMPGFAFDFLDAGCMEDACAEQNRRAWQAVKLLPHGFSATRPESIQSELFGTGYNAPYGIAPIGLTGLIWPGAARILAESACRYRLPYCFSGICTESMEDLATLAQDVFWFQMYHPRDPHIRRDLLRRARAAGARVLVLSADIRSVGRRPKDIANGFALPPQRSLTNLLQTLRHPPWLLDALRHPPVSIQTMEPYAPDSPSSMRRIRRYIMDTFAMTLTEDTVAAVRQEWDGALVIKGLLREQDVETAIRLGADGILVSNHGGRQSDASPATLDCLRRLAAHCKGDIPLMLDGGIQSGLDIARAYACGADFVFLGRLFLYGIGALGPRGAAHVMSMLNLELLQILQQLGCRHPQDLPRHLDPEAFPPR